MSDVNVTNATVNATPTATVTANTSAKATSDSTGTEIPFGLSGGRAAAGVEARPPTATATDSVRAERRPEAGEAVPPPDGALVRVGAPRLGHLVHPHRHRAVVPAAGARHAAAAAEPGGH